VAETALNQTVAPQRLPWPALTVALIALASYVLCAGGAYLCAALALGILASYVVDARLGRGSLQIRTVRLLVMGTLVMIRLSESERLGSYAYIDLYIGLVGQLSATEMTLQFWQWPPYGGPSGAVVLCLSGLVFVSAAKTEDAAYIPWLTPLYFIFLTLALHRARNRTGGGRMRRALPALLALSLALGIGLGTSSAIWSWRNELTIWFTRLTLPSGHNEGIGISQVPVLGATSGLRLSAARVLRIEGPLRDPYLRGMAFDTYGHGVWTPTISARHFETVAAPELVNGEVHSRVQITRLVNDFRILVAPLNCTGVVMPRKAIEWDREDGGPLRTWIWLSAPTTHDILLSDNDEHQGPLCVPLSTDYRRRCLTVPAEVDRRVYELARSITAGTDDPREKVQRIESYLKSHNDYSTTTDPGKGDPVSSFILEHKAAHCEYFASAMVILLRCIKIPARYVTGYYAFDRSEKDTIIVRQKHAHAWAECHLDGIGWIPADPTPPSGRPDHDTEPIPWYISFSEWLQDSWDHVRDWMADLSLMQQMTAVMSLIAFVLALQWMRKLRNGRKDRAIDFSYASPGEELNALAAQFESLLKSHQLTCPAHKTWAEHLSSLAAEQQANLHFNSAEAANFARQYATVRFGNPESKTAVSALAEALRKLRKA
jgi:transglutaminase-like putative cysteine protease